MRKDFYFLSCGKILGYYYELDASNSRPKFDSRVTPASTLKNFIANAKKIYNDKKIIINKVG